MRTKHPPPRLPLLCAAPGTAISFDALAGWKTKLSILLSQRLCRMANRLLHITWDRNGQHRLTLSYPWKWENG